LKLIESQNHGIMTAALHTLAKIIRSERMKTNWSSFLELIILKIIDSYKAGKEVSFQVNDQVVRSFLTNNQFKKVQREVDVIISKMAAVLPVDASISILNPVIATGTFPSNLCALKILRDLADQQGKDFNDHHLDILMPNIARVSFLLFVYFRKLNFY
jgi:CLIP-associating protein 1/2